MDIFEVVDVLGNQLGIKIGGGIKPSFWGFNRHAIGIGMTLT
jgi:hypothetical protein